MTFSAQLFTDAAFKDHTSFWKAALENVTTDFHFRQPWLAYAPETTTSISVDVSLQDETARVIEEIARGRDLGILVMVVSAISFVLHKYTSAPAVHIDSPALKDQAEPEYAGNAVPLIMTWESGSALSIRDHLNQTRNALGSSYSFQNFPIRGLAEVLLKRPLPRTNVVVCSPAIHDTALSAAEYDLCITVTRDSRLGIQLCGKSPAFSREYLRTFANHLGNVLNAYRDVSRPLSSVDLMGTEERDRILVSYNKTDRSFPLEKTIHGLFYDRARNSALKPAIRFHERTTTYEALNKLSNQLAWSLQSDYDIRPGDVVGVITHRSELFIAGLLGVLKAGAVYLPIDPDYPEERLQFMVSDAAVKLLLVHSEHLNALGALHETPMFALDLQLTGEGGSGADLPSRAAATDPAYIIYTSGSTGQPKAVLLEHRGFVNMVLHHIDAFGFDASDRLLQFYGHSFDSSMFEIFVALLSGATVVMVAKDTIKDPRQLSNYIEEQQVTTLTLPPIYLSTLDRSRLNSVRRFISAGDNCRVDDAAHFAQTRDYYNSYGPTETSVCVTHYKVDPAVRYGSRIPIGKSISNTRIYLLDDNLNPVPEGIPGEICVGGVSLARGYLNRPELTAEKFVGNPFVRGERLYRTGDLGVWLPDGNLELIGRKDNQVKIRGYRVELGEIEAVIAQHRDVKETVVLAREDASGNKRLIAYVTGADTLEAADLRLRLHARLPEFMIPSAFVVLDRMPVTANGKIDRKALPDPSASDPGSGFVSDGGAPANAIQATLVRIWKEVLGVDRLGVHDNLFERGGDSILVIQIVSRARDAGLVVAPHQLFEYQTIASLSEVVMEAASREPADDVADSLDGLVPLTPIQHWFFEQDIADRHHFNQSVMLEIPAGLDPALAETATRAIVAHHDALRLRFSQQNGAWSAEYGPLPEAVPFSVADVSGSSDHDRDHAIRESASDLQADFDLSSGPLIRVRLFTPGDGKPARLLFVVHHLAVDGVSWRILLEDFHAAYRGASLPRKTASGKRWAARLQEYAAAGSIDREFWLDPARRRVSPIPTDHPVDANSITVESSEEVIVELDAAATSALLREAPAAYNTEINDVLLTALTQTFVEWTGNNALLMDLEGHGRESLFDDLDISRTVGWFTAQFPVLLQLPASSGIGDAVKSVKEQLRAIPRRGIGYGLLRYLSRDSHVVHELKSFPKPDVLFNYLGQTGRALAPEMNWTPVLGLNGLEQSPRGKRTHLLEVTGMILEGRLRLSWVFSKTIHSKTTMERLALRYLEVLRQLIEHCSRVETSEYTPSDFPAAKLDQKSLDALVARIKSS